MATELILSPAAGGDLQAIRTYSEVSWGEDQATRYIERILGRLHWLLTNPEAGRVRTELLPGVRSLSVERHVVFYRVQCERIEVIRILSERQDFPRASQD